ncbi:MAG: hypothetical protein U1F23_02725 [Lysobacterales bacterium]
MGGRDVRFITRQAAGEHLARASLEGLAQPQGAIAKRIERHAVRSGQALPVLDPRGTVGVVVGEDEFALCSRKPIEAFPEGSEQPLVGMVRIAPVRRERRVIEHALLALPALAGLHHQFARDAEDIAARVVDGSAIVEPAAEPVKRDIRQRFGVYGLVATQQHDQASTQALVLHGGIAAAEGESPDECRKRCLGVGINILRPRDGGTGEPTLWRVVHRQSPCNTNPAQ